ncbi:DUF4169 family protein [Xanthobacter sp. TB0136]|uniref:DUF4169 family protein n=1 Tax=Xanthobacter sp. TB0136 TaxID=3459177 RepID=UPI00403916B4
MRCKLGDVISLHRERKVRTRRAEQAKAEENRVRFGRPRAERDITSKTLERQRRLLEGHALTGREENEKPRG